MKYFINKLHCSILGLVKVLSITTVILLTWFLCFFSDRNYGVENVTEINVTADDVERCGLPEEGRYFYIGGSLENQSIDKLEIFNPSIAHPGGWEVGLNPMEKALQCKGQSVEDWKYIKKINIIICSLVAAILLLLNIILNLYAPRKVHEDDEQEIKKVDF